MRAWLGVDPGKRGAAALITSDGVAQAVSYPGDISQAADIVRGWKAEYEIKLAGLERVHSMPAQGVRSVFSFGENFGSWQGILAAMGIPYELVTPQAWQRGLVVPSDGKTPKERALTVARRLYPALDLHRKSDDGRADALLLATWAKRRG